MSSSFRPILVVVFLFVLFFAFIASSSSSPSFLRRDPHVQPKTTRRADLFLDFPLTHLRDQPCSGAPNPRRHRHRSGATPGSLQNPVCGIHVIGRRPFPAEILLEVRASFLPNLYLVLYLLSSCHRPRRGAWTFPAESSCSCHQPGGNTAVASPTLVSRD